ncbi:MAG: Ig-like domain-containing protein [Patescibacteria group bacterium]|nr:Ig-like domain-containing protein [Patescibacteria group bacterium]
MFKNKQKVFGKIGNFFSYKATITVLSLVVLFLLFSPAAKALQTGLEYGTAAGLGTQDLRVTVMKIVRIFLGFIGIIAIIINLYAGYLWMSSGGNAEQLEKAKKTLRNALIGLVIIFSAFMIVSFIIGSLEKATGLGNIPGGGPPGACENCSQLGNGILQSVYPVPWATNVPRNTEIMVTFKVAMDATTIVKSCVTLPCSGDLVSNNVQIYPNDSGAGAKLTDTQVLAATNDGKTFVFYPKDYLGNSVTNTWYAVKLTSDIKKDNGQVAFTGGFGDYYLWRFEIGTFLDLDPVELNNVFPQPDDEGDTYSVSAAVPATGSVYLNTLPQIDVAAATSNIVGTPTSPNLVINGTYNCTNDALICVTVSGSNVTVSPKNVGAADCSAPSITVTGLNSAAPISGGAANIGCGLNLSFASAPVEGNHWSFSAVSAKTADTLRVDSRLYSFVSTNPTGDQIARAASTALQAQVIAAKINDDHLGVTAFAAGSKIDLTATIAGQTGNGIPLQSLGGWATITAMGGGANADLTPATNQQPDKPRNAVITLDFSEAIDPLQLSPTTIQIQYDSDPGAGETWTNVTGSYLVSNQYQTVEFLSDNACVDALGNPVINSCGDRIYCLPVNDPTPYEATHYRAIVKAATLKNCASAADCSDSNFKVCATAGAGTVCQGDFDGIPAFYPVAQQPNPAGLTDAANNSFNGNRNSYFINGIVFGRAEGPQPQSGQPPYSLNDQADNTGDDLIWQFYVNKNINLAPPILQAIGPPIADTNTSLVDPITGEFNELMQSSTLKPGSNYRDGQCFCNVDSDCSSTNSETCDTTYHKCVSENQKYCEQDKECATNICVNKKYLSLIDQTASPAGWWVTKIGLDTVSPHDNYADQTQANLNHTKLIEVTNYGSEFGSGVKDIYQNCYLPSNGPGFPPQPSCAATAVKPYCCNGTALSKTSWEASDCFTGY